jgi:GNAT superfamily N-acetyltransferase
VIELRSADLEDIPELSRLRWHLYDEISPVLGESSPDYQERFTPFAEDALRSEAWHIVVATNREELVGAMWVYRVPRIPQPGHGPAAPLAYLTSVYVAPAHRDSGLGSRMLTDIQAWCRDEGFSLIMAWPSDRSTPFYERAGFIRPAGPLVRDLRSGP